MSVLVIIPTYKEKDNIRKIVNHIDNNEFYSGDIKFIIIDDTPNTSVKVESNKSNKITYIKNGKRLGYGLSLRKGLYIAKFLYVDVVIVMDADHPIEDVEEIVNMIYRDKYYFVLGNEREKTIFSKVTKIMLRFGLGIKSNHPTCGYMGFSRGAINDLNVDKCISNNDMLHVEFVLQMMKRRDNCAEFVFSGQNKNNKVGYSGYSLKRILIWIIDYLKVVYRALP